MSYLAAGDIDFSGIFKTGAELVDTYGSAAVTAVQVADDPAFPEIACQAVRLTRINAGEPAGEPCTPTVMTAANANKGIGLSEALVPVRTLVWMRANPMITGSVLFGALASIWLTGYVAGRMK